MCMSHPWCVCLTPGVYVSPLLLLGVPVSTQWGPKGYFYPIQVAQYGLSHYSKNLTERPPSVELYDRAEGTAGSPSPWTVPKGCSLTKLLDSTRPASTRQFSAPGECHHHPVTCQPQHSLAPTHSHTTSTYVPLTI